MKTSTPKQSFITSNKSLNQMFLTISSALGSYNWLSLLFMKKVCALVILKSCFTLALRSEMISSALTSSSSVLWYMELLRSHIN